MITFEETGSGWKKTKWQKLKGAEINLTRIYKETRQSKIIYYTVKKSVLIPSEPVQAFCWKSQTFIDTDRYLYNESVNIFCLIIYQIELESIIVNTHKKVPLLILTWLIMSFTLFLVSFKIGETLFFLHAVDVLVKM